MEFTDEKVLHRSEHSEIALVTDTNGNEYIRKTGKFSTDALSAISKIDSPYIAKIVSYSDSQAIMEYISGKPLSEISLPQEQVFEVICEICKGLVELHSAGVIHRDIKPSNIMLCDDGHIKIIDFDAARIKKPQAEKDTSFIGTDGFAPPEQYGFMQTDERSDIYALGVTIKLLLKENYEKSPIRAVAEKCMRFDPGKRYSSAAKVKTAIIARRYRAVPIACATVIAAAGVVIAVTFMLNKTNDVPVSAPVSDTSEQAAGIIAGVITTADTITFAEVMTTPLTAEPTTVAETAKSEISFLPEGFPALPNGITKVDDTEHIKKIEWEKLAQDDVSMLVESITEWLGESAEVDDKSTRMGRTIQWKCSNNTFSGYIILLYVEDTEKYSAFPQCRLSISIADS